jgi:hypothetical protein
MNSTWKKAGISALVALLFDIVFVFLTRDSNASQIIGAVTYWGMLNLIKDEEI